MSDFNSLVQYTVENISRPIKYIIYKLTEFIRVVDKFVFRQVPAGAASGYATIEKIEGNTVKFNQSASFNNSSETKYGLNITVSDDVVTITGTAESTFPSSGYYEFTTNIYTLIAQHKYLTQLVPIRWNVTNNAFIFFRGFPNAYAKGLKDTQTQVILTASSAENKVRIYTTATTQIDIQFRLQLIDLTAIFGAGNEPTTVEEFEAWLAQNIGTLPYYDYNAGELLSCKMSGMQTEDSSQQTLDTIALDVTTITGINTATNVREAIFPNGMKQADQGGTVKDMLDLRSDTATVKVGSRAYQSGDESDTAVITDGRTTYFPSIEGYKRLDNVTIPSSSYLITNIQPRGDIHIEMDFETTTFAAGGQLYMGGRDGTAGSGIGFGHNSNHDWICDGLTGTRYTSSYIMLPNTRYVFRWLNGVATLLTGGISVATNTFSPTITPTTPLSINGYNINGGVSAGETIKVYAFRAWNSQGEMIANYVPVVNITTSQVGLYDFVSGAFLQPTAGTWTAGTVLLPITYTDLQDANGNPLNPRYKVEQGGTEQVLPVNTSTPTTVAPTLTTTYTKDNN